MKKVFLICPAAPSQMPYIQSYIDILKKLSFDYELIVWDRKGTLSNDEFLYLYQDSIASLKRGFLDYYRFSKFFNSVLRDNDGGFVIAFGIPVLFFMKKNLFNKFKVISDIRDFHILRRFFPSLVYILKKTALNVLSSAGYERWLPKRDDYIVNHNTNFDSKGLLDILELPSKGGVVSCIGALKDFNVLEQLIDEAIKRDDKRFVFKFHGEGVINDQLKELKRRASNVSIEITGAYLKHQEITLYNEADWVNNFMTNNNINNDTCLSNRLYNAAYYGKPLLCYKGSYLADLVDTYKLGMVFNDVNDFYDNFDKKFRSFNIDDFNLGRRRFFEKVDVDNRMFENFVSSMLVLEK